METGQGRRMLMRENLPIAADELFGYALVTYLETEWKQAAAVMAALLARGIRCRENRLSMDRISESSYTDTVLPLIDGCESYVFLFTKEFLESREESLSVLRNHIWYQIGYFSSAKTEDVIDRTRLERVFWPINFPEPRLTLGDLPLQIEQVHYLTLDPRIAGKTPLEFAEDMAVKCPLLCRDSFFGGVPFSEHPEMRKTVLRVIERGLPSECPPEGEDGQGLLAAVRRCLRDAIRADFPSSEEARRSLLEEAAEPHIRYHRIRLRLPVAEEDVRAVCQRIGRDEASLLAVLSEGIGCGAHLFYFGKTDQETARELPLLPYAKEREMVPAAYPRVRERDGAPPSCLRRLRWIPRGKEGVYGEYRIDLVLPVHSLFGVTFKLYLETDGITPEAFRELFRHTFTDANDVAQDDSRAEARLWFSLGLNKSATEVLPERAAWGCRRDVIFPQ